MDSSPHRAPADLGRYAFQITMVDFKKRYRQAYENLGQPLTSEDAMSAEVILKAQNESRVRLPKALLDYYLVAGRESHFNCHQDRLLPPDEWFVDEGRFVFYEENQIVVVYGISTATGQTDDPPVEQGVNGETIDWYPEHEHCSVFLLVTLHWQAAMGAMPYGAEASTTQDLRLRLDAGWSFVGEVNQMRAYSRPGQVVCFLLWDKTWKAFVGATSKDGVNRIAVDLNLVWDGSNV